MSSGSPTFDDLLEACIAVFEVVEAEGTAEMKLLARALLFAAGEEAAKRLLPDA